MDRIRKFTLGVIIILIFLVLGMPVQAGGWAVATLVELPSQVIENEPFTIQFAVRQHGTHLTSEFSSPVIRVNHPESGITQSFKSKKTFRQGYFTTEILLPVSGTWMWEIDLYNDPTLAQTMPPLTVDAGEVFAATPPVEAFSSALFLGVIGIITLIGAGVIFLRSRNRWALGFGLAGILLFAVAISGWDQQPVEAAIEYPSNEISQVELGKALFMAKGCVVCHTHAVGQRGFTGIQTNIGPDLTQVKRPAEYIELWLADPALFKPETLMPNLELEKNEIKALAEFLTADHDQK
jgi:mono/diheme cytochrome c family protein